MTDILRDEITLLTKKIEFELKLLCYQQQIYFEKLYGKGSISILPYGPVLGAHYYTSIGSVQSVALSEIGEVGLMCNRLTRLNNASSYTYDLEHGSAISFLFS